MSDNSSVKIGSLDSKIQEISDYLKSSVIEPAQEEKQSLIEEGEKEKERIITEAKAEAEKIIKKAQSEADTLKQNTESALKIAAKQAIDRVKLAVEKEVLNFSVNEPVKDALKSDEIIKYFVSEVIEQYADSKINYTITLSDSTREKVSSYLEQQIKSKALEGIQISKDSLPSGFSVTFGDESLKIDFTQESIVELFTEYIRPELRKTLFEK